MTVLLQKRGNLDTHRRLLYEDESRYQGDGATSYNAQKSTRSYDRNIEQILILNTQKEPILLTKLVDVIDLQLLEW